MTPALGPCQVENSQIGGLATMDLSFLRFSIANFVERKYPQNGEGEGGAGGELEATQKPGRKKKGVCGL